MDIRKSHNATVEMAIADFFHCENIPDAVVESPRSKRLVNVDPLIPGHGQTIPRSVSFTRQHHLNVARESSVRRDPKVLRRVSWILNKEGLHFANLFYIFE